MPRIPLSEGPGLIRHVRDSVPMRGAPGMDFNMEQGRALSRLGEQIADAGRDIGESGMRIADARARFLEAQQASIDKLMASEARNWYKTLNAELSQRMAENPNEYEHFAEWARETDETYRNGVVAWTDKMSEKYRKEFESEMEGLRIEKFKERSLIGIHAKVTNDYNLFQARFKDFAERGDYEEVKRLLDDHRGVLISESEYQQKLLDYHRLADFGAAKRAVEAGDASIIEKLQERDKDGNYVNFTHLEEGRRGQLIRVAQAKETQRETEADQAVLVKLADGEIPYTDEKLKQMLENGELNNRQYATYKEWFAEKRRRDQLEAEQLAASQERKKAAADREAARQEAARENLRKADKAQRRTAVDALLNTAGYDDNGYARKLDDAQFRQCVERAKEICGGNFDLYGDALKRLNELRSADLSYRDTPLYKFGDSLLGAWKKDGKMVSYKGINDTSETAALVIERSMRVDLAEFLKNNPKATANELFQHLNERLEHYQEQKIADILAGEGAAEALGGTQ